MARFNSAEDLRGFLKDLCSDYEQYTHALWANGVTLQSMLANATLEDLVKLGGLPPIHASDIKARSGAPAWLNALGSA